MKARYWLLLGAAAWAPIIVATCSEPPSDRRATPVTLAAAEVAQIEQQADTLCRRHPAGHQIALPDGVLVCAGEQRRPRSRITALVPATPTELKP